MTSRSASNRKSGPKAAFAFGEGAKNSGLKTQDLTPIVPQRVEAGKTKITSRSGPEPAYRSPTVRTDNPPHMAMALFLDGRSDELTRLCQEHGVSRLDLFGSATGTQFDPDRSDIDFIVEFGPAAQPHLFVHYFALKQGLESLFARPVDLVMAGAMRNPYFIESAARTRQPVYAPTVTETA